MANTSPARPGAPVGLKARRVTFSFPTGTNRQHYVNDDMVASHFFTVLSAFFPEGEDFFIRSVRAHRAEITNPVLQDAIKGFIAQEATHRHQHRMLNDRLEAMGYPTGRIDRHTTQLFTWWEKVLGPKLCLASTAAFEHYTGVLGEIVLSSDEMQGLLGESDVRSLLLWHAFEECEHKAVAFDVYRSIGGTERMRIAAMVIVQLIFWPEVLIQTARSLASDREAYRPLHLIRSVNKFRKSPIFSRDAFHRYHSYFRPGFHPDDWDTTDLIAHWATELFDDEGAQRVRGA